MMTEMGNEPERKELIDEMIAIKQKLEKKGITPGEIMSRMKESALPEVAGACPTGCFVCMNSL